MSGPLWTPSPADVAQANVTRFISFVNGRGAAVHDYSSLYAWSIARPEEFWSALWEFSGIVAERDALGSGRAWRSVLIGGDRMAPPDPTRGPRWFDGARLNFAENLLRFRDEHVAIIAWNELGAGRRLTYAQLYAETARLAATLRAHGVRAGDRIAAFMPNVPETIIAMLATASIGAIWSSCSPDFGVQGVMDRFGQIEPRILFCADGYRYSGKEVDSLRTVAGIAQRISKIERIVVVPYMRERPDVSEVPRAVMYEDFIGSTPEHELEFARLPFDQPLYVMYSSGTTGLPKCMVHGAGGTLLQHQKEHLLHCNLTRGDRVFYFTTCGWMMWNWLASALAVGSTLVLYDGAAFLRGRAILWDMAAAERITVFGTSAKWLALAEKEGLRPRQTHDLSALESILSTGSPLAANSFDYVYEHVKSDVRLSSISGGTDLVSCFALGNPIGPVWRGEIQVRGLGMKVEVFDEEGHSIIERPGELVCTAPFPSMPIYFWNDSSGEKYRSAYFDHFPNVWRHGDWAELTSHDGVVIYGRSDATLNPGGIRIGTAEIYRQVDQLPEVLESLVVAQELPGAHDDVRIVLFVRLVAGELLSEALKERIRLQIRRNASPHHVPKKIVQVADIPRTISGKITELAVRDVIHGRPVRNRDALANPDALELFRDLPELRD
ncbi:MAG TPA: acetoacetate--CoA ligase [Gemmatimonadaceae bacterium]